MHAWKTAAVPRHVGRPLVLAVAGLLAAILVGSAPGVAHATVCPAGNFCSATFGDVTYTVIGPCDTSSLSAISGCFIVGVGPTPGGSGEPLNVCSQYGCGAAAIVQEGVSVTDALEREARQKIAALRGVPDDTLNVYWSREQIKAYMYLRLIAMANAAAGSLSAEDQEVVDYYTDLINEERATAAQAARDLYDRWHSDPCNFKVPVGDPDAYLKEPDVWGTFLNPGACRLAQNPLSIACLLGLCVPPPPTAEQFTAWAEGATLEAEIGAWAKALQDVSPSLTDEQARHSAAFEHDAAVGGIEQGVAYLTATHSQLADVEAGTETPAELALEEAWLEGWHEAADDRLREVVQTVIGQVYKALQNAVADGIAEIVVEDAAGAAIETWDTLVGPILAGLLILAVEAWEQVDNASVPVKLDTALAAARNGQSLKDYASRGDGRALILSALLKSTLPDYLSYRLASASGVAAGPGPVKDSDPVFQQGASTARTGLFQSYDWNGNFVFTSVRDGWFVQSRNNNPWRYTPVVDYVTDGNERWHAWLSGTQFLVSRVAIDAGDAQVVAGVNVCGQQSPLLPSGNINLGNVCVLSTNGGAFLKTIKANDQVEIEGQVRTVAAVSGDGTWFSTKAPFGDPAPSGRVWILAHPKGDCSTSSSLGDRTQGPDCVKGSSIATSLGTVVMNPRPTLTITASSATVAFGDPVPTITPIYDGFLNGDTAAALSTPPVCTTSYSRSALGGTYETHCSGAASSVYNIQYVAGLVTVTVPPLTITASSPTIVYGAPVPAIAPIYAGSNPSSLRTAPTCTTTYTQGSPAGTYPTSCTGAVPPETIVPCDKVACTEFKPIYTISYVTGTLTVNPAPLTITASSASVTYGDGVPAIPASYGGFVGTDTAASLTTPPTCTTIYTKGAGAGSYPTSCSGAIGANYAIGYAAGSVTVKPAPLTITASSASMTYGGTPPTITASYGGFLNGDGVSSLTTPPTCATTATSASPAGTYPSSCSGAVAANYTAGYVPGTVTVSYGATGVDVHKTPNHAGSTIPIKVRLLAANGANVSSAAVTLTLVNPAVSPSPTPGAQPTGTFTFVPPSNGGPEYQHNVKTKDYPKGRYTLSFTVSGDPVVHTVEFALD